MSHLEFWVNALLDSLEAELDEETYTRVLMNCGRACAAGGAVQAAQQIREGLADVDGIDALIEALNQNHLGGGDLRREGDVIRGTYQECYCPTRKAGLIRSRNFCHCTRGWSQAVFEAALGRPVEVELEKTIGWGDGICQFAVRFARRTA